MCSAKAANRALMSTKSRAHAHALLQPLHGTASSMHTMAHAWLSFLQMLHHIRKPMAGSSGMVRHLHD